MSRHAHSASGAPLGWVASGDGDDTVVLLPSLGRQGSDFDDLAGVLVAGGWRTIQVDLHGTGSSQGAAAPADLHAMSADVVDVARREGAGRIHLVGHAFGNRVSRCIAADAPDLVRSLVLLGCGGKVPGDPDARRALQECFDLAASLDVRRAAIATAFFAGSAEVPPAWMMGWWPAGATAQSAASAATDVADWWIPPEPIPVLAIVGRGDRISPPDNARALVEGLGSRGWLLEVDGAGHALLPEQLGVLADAVLAFLRSSSLSIDGVAVTPPSPTESLVANHQ